MKTPTSCRSLPTPKPSLFHHLLAAMLMAFAPSDLFAQTHHYEPVPDRLVGIWPADWSVEHLTTLRRSYGYSGIYIWPSADQYAAALQAGFSPQRIMAALPWDSYETFILGYPAGYYYLDEPAEHDCYGHPSGYRLLSPEELAARTHFVHYHRPGSKFVISGYKRCSHNLLAATNADIFMFSSYHHWSSTGLPICHVNMGYANEWEAPWISGSEDQRDDWSEFRDELGGRFAMTWVHGVGDEYDQLFDHAANLGLYAVWVYTESPPGGDRLEEISAAAATHGWLTKVEGTPLPVQLTSFRAMDLGATRARLVWETASEFNAYGFSVERRTDAPQPYAEVPGGFLPAHGTTTETHAYAFEDHPPAAGMYVYRLKIADLDGSFNFSEEIDVHVTGRRPRLEFSTDRPILQSYPNPFNPSTTFRFQIPAKGPVILAVFNILGEEVGQLVRGSLQAGTHDITWDARDLPSGFYVCRLWAAGMVEQTRILLVR